MPADPPPPSAPAEPVAVSPPLGDVTRALDAGEGGPGSASVGGADAFCGPAETASERAGAIGGSVLASTAGAAGSGRAAPGAGVVGAAGEFTARAADAGG